MCVALRGHAGGAVPKTALRKRLGAQHRMNLGLKEEEYIIVNGHIFSHSHFYLEILQSST